MNKTLAIIIVIIIVLGGGYLLFHHSSSTTNSGYGSGYGTDTDDATQVNTGTDMDMTGSSTTATTSDATTGTTKTFTVSGGNYYFTPSTLTVNKGDTVTIHFVNAGGMHDLVVDGFNAKTPVIGSGQTADITFVADQAGTFDYYCSVGDHRAMGMQGTLTVNG